MRETVPSPTFATHSEPDVTAVPYGLRPTRIVATTLFVCGLIHETVPSSLLVTQSERLTKASP